MQYYLQDLSPNKNTDYSLWKAARRFSQPKQPVPALKRPSVGWTRGDKGKETLFAEHLSEVFIPHQATKDSEEEKKLQDYLDLTHQMSLLIKSTSPNKVRKVINSN